MSAFILITMQIVTVLILFGLTIFLPVGVPAAFISSVAAIIWFFSTGQEMFSIWSLGFFIFGAVVGEVLEQVMGLLGAKKFGASKKGMWGAVLGGLLGAVLGSFIPIPIVGTILGVFVGCFALTFVFEYLLAKRDHKESLKAGMGALIGKVIAVSVKYSIAFTILIFIVAVFVKYDINYFKGKFN